MLLLSIFLSFLLFQNGHSAATGLPSFLKVCHLNDPELNLCIKTSAQNGIKEFVKGDPERGIPSMDPVSLKRIQSLRGGTINLTLVDVDVFQLGDLTFDKVTIDTKAMKIVSTASGDLKFAGNYEMDGKVSVFSLRGQGKITANVTNIYMIYTINYKLVDKNGIQYPKITKTTLDARNVELVELNLANLFSSELLNKNTNEVINESWKEVYDQISPPILTEFNKRVAKILQKLFDVVPYAELLLPN